MRGVEACIGCPLGERTGDPEKVRCRHPDRGETETHLVDAMRRPPKDCPLRTGPIMIGLPGCPGERKLLKPPPELKG